MGLHIGEEKSFFQSCGTIGFLGNFQPWLVMKALVSFIMHGPRNNRTWFSRMWSIERDVGKGWAS